MRPRPPEHRVTGPRPQPRRRHRARTAAALVVTAAVLALTVAPPAAARGAAPVPDAPPVPAVSTAPSTTSVGTTTSPPSAPATAQVWSTTGDGTSRLSPGVPVAATTDTTTTLPTIAVDPAQRFQPVTGVGAALTHSSASLLMGLPADRRRAVLTELFAPDGPVRLSVVRIPLGGSDFVVGQPYTFDDTPGNVTDWSLSRFSTARDATTLIPVLQQIKTINPAVVVVASPWSAPAWMKTTLHLNAGRLSTDRRAVGTYASYLVKALAAYRGKGVSIDYLTVQNEPQTRTWADYPRMEMPVRTQVDVINALGPRLRSAGLATQVLGFDHNWQQHPADVAAVPAGGDPEHDYPARLLRSSAAPWVSGTAFHCYHGDASAQEPLRAEFPTRSIWVTECSGSHGPGDTPERIFADTVYWQSRNLLIASLRHWATAVMTWNLALDASGGPHTGGCSTCTSVVTIQDGTVTPTAEYYVLAQAARAVPRGSVRVASSTTSAALDGVAFRAPDGSTSVLVHHGGWPAAAVRVQVDGLSYDVTVPAWSVSTIRIGAPTS